MSDYYSSVYIVGNSGQLYLVAGYPQLASVEETIQTYDGQNLVAAGFVGEQVGNTDSYAVLQQFAGAAVENLHLQDTRGAIWAGVYEKLNAPEAWTPILAVLGAAKDIIVSPQLNALLASATAFPEQTESLTIATKLVGAFALYLADTVGVTVSASMLYVAVQIISNLLQIVGSPKVMANAAPTVAVVLAALEQVAVSKEAHAESLDTLSLNMAVLGAILLQYSVSERVSLLDNIPALAIAYPSLAELLGLQDEQNSGFGKEVSETADLTALIADLLSARPQIIDVLNSLDTTAPTFVVQITCSDTAEMIDPPTGGVAQAVMQALASENFSIFIGYTANDGVYDGWVINTNSSAVSQYKGWAFNSFAEFYGQYLGASASGLAVLDGPTDAGANISAMIQTAVTDLGSSHQKRVRSAYLGIAATGTCYLQVLTDDNIERTYQLVPNAPGLGNERVDLARGVQSRYWSFSLESVDGSAWRLDNLEALPVVLSRRVR